MMVKHNGSSGDGSQTSHRCGVLCLGPLAFHSQAVGQMVRLSCGGQRAERAGSTFKNGLVFSSRPVKVQEKICLRVEKDSFSWHGALRLGFTNVAPSNMPLPLPMMAIPNLIDSPGNWAAPVHDEYCRAGSEIEFWFSSGGSMYFTSNSSQPYKLFTGVDLSRPLWAVIDIYGQTCSILLLGSKKKQLFSTSRSCPVHKPLTWPDHSLISDVSSLCKNENIACLDTNAPTDERCVVCLAGKASITLPCGHRCLCRICTPQVLQQFGTCPLCRYVIRVPAETGVVSWTASG